MVNLSVKHVDLVNDTTLVEVRYVARRARVAPGDRARAIERVPARVITTDAGLDALRRSAWTNWSTGPRC